MNTTKVVFSFIVLASCGLIYGVHYQREQERLFMRRGILRELEEERLKRNNQMKPHD